MIVLTAESLRAAAERVRDALEVSRGPASVRCADDCTCLCHLTQAPATASTKEDDQ